MKKRKKDIKTDPALSLEAEELELLKSSVDADREQRRRLEPYDNSDGARLTRYAKRNKTFVCILAAALALLILTLSLGGVFFYRFLSGLENKDDFTLKIGDEEYTVPYEEVVIDGEVYVDMYDIAEYASLIVSGSDTRVKFTADENNYLKFENESREAVINGSLVDVSGVTFVDKDRCSVPIKFLQKTFGIGLRLSLDRETNTIEIKRRMYSTDDKDVFLPVEILFYTDSFTILMGITDIPQDYGYEYAINVDAFMSYIEPENADEYLVLANKDTPLSSDYAPSDLSFISCNTNGKAIKLRNTAERALYALMLEMESEGITDTFVTSAYRNYSYQKGLFEQYTAYEMNTISDDAIKHFGNDYIYEHYTSQGLTSLSEEDAVAVVLTYSAFPGTSEHQTGLCIDFMTLSMKELDESFEDSEAFEWLSVNAHKYGFILRYPKDKTDITGYKYEPWHYRFVGREAATEIYLSGLTLEEYLTLN